MSPTGVFDRGPGSAWAAAMAAKKRRGKLAAQVKRGRKRLGNPEGLSSRLGRTPDSAIHVSGRSVPREIIQTERVAMEPSSIPRGCEEVSPFFFGWRRIR